jgi:hypothetical protein
MEWRCRTTVRFQAGHIPSCCVTCERGWQLLPIANGCGWLPALLSPLLSGAIGERGDWAHR